MSPLELATVTPSKRKRNARPAYSYRAQRRNYCIRGRKLKWAEFSRVVTWKWRVPAVPESKA
jgi:hypothetical protein